MNINSNIFKNNTVLITLIKILIIMQKVKIKKMPQNKNIPNKKKIKKRQERSSSGKSRRRKRTGK